MEYGFLVKLRCFTRVDKQLLKCIETRYYYEFGQPSSMIRERRWYRDDYDAFFAVLTRPLFFIVHSLIPSNYWLIV